MADLELSTQMIIHEAKARGYDVDILDRLNNFIRIRGKGRTEYIMQATRTRADSYISPLIMENKSVTKEILKLSGIQVPYGEVFSSELDLRETHSAWKDKAFVIKPNSSNFGISVFLFPDGADEDRFNYAVETAFHSSPKSDKQVLIEELFAGKEYRFLVIGDFVRAVLHRIPANVTGDGSSTIAELVKRKNDNPLRGEGYTKPLERITLGRTELMVLQSQGDDFDTVPETSQNIYLRENANISTGGDSIDFTDDVHSSYKDIAAAASRAVGANISGVDMIIQNIAVPANGKNYSIIELNYNPALHIHDFPAVGKNRNVEAHVLNLLGL
jgi:glutamate--cysteine ligase